MKTDITINKTMLLSPKQFENFKPSISLTLKDVSVSQLGDAQSTLNEIAEELFKLEISNQYYLYKNIKEQGIDAFSHSVVKDINNTIENLEKNQNLLIEMNSKSIKF